MTPPGPPNRRLPQPLAPPSRVSGFPASGGLHQRAITIYLTLREKKTSFSIAYPASFLWSHFPYAVKCPPLQILIFR
ncbi:hypothetical protein L1887_11194 [Cichorium endivia]|nr:hypothetical protein L1887_11194 [Cichorium endivia]